MARLKGPVNPVTAVVFITALFSAYCILDTQGVVSIKRYDHSNSLKNSDKFSPELNLSLPIKLYITGQNTAGLPKHEITEHPLDPLSPSEVRLAKFMISSIRGFTNWVYRWVTLKEPEKATLIRSFLQDNDFSVMQVGAVDRRALVMLQDPYTDDHFEAVINLNKFMLESWKQVDSVGPIVSMDDVISAEGIALENLAVVKRVQSAGYNVSQIVCDTWDAGYIADNPNYAAARKLLQVYFYAVESAEDNFYAHPLDFVVYVDLHSNMVRGIETVPSTVGFSRDNVNKGKYVPKEQANYIPKDSTEKHTFIVSEKLNPIQVSQPKGPSFKLHGNRVKWHDFVFRVGYNGREGVVLHHVKHNRNNDMRPLIYRMSLSEIMVTYGDPRPPYHRKKSLDMGEYKLGFTLAQLPRKTLCTGDARYQDVTIHNDAGDPMTITDAICIYEEDAGPLWMHYDRANDKTVVQRSQRLSVSFLSTLGHTDYWISWRFYQDATIELSVKLTGLKSTNLMGVDVKSPMYGSLISPQIYSQISQYFFSARIDADVGSERNSVAVQDIVPVDGEVGSTTNPYGNGIMKKETILKTVEQAKTKSSPESGRTWKIMNNNQVHSVTRAPVAWKLVPRGDHVPLLLKKNSPLRTNSTTSWSDFSVWALPYSDERIFASGLWKSGDGLWDWANDTKSENLMNTDIVLWHTFGITSVPSVEDWPVSSDFQGNTGFILKPDAFFDRNPAL